MNAFAHFPSHLHWTAQELTDAVPLRLHELFAFDARVDIEPCLAANRDRRQARMLGGYRVRAALPPRFGVR